MATRVISRYLHLAGLLSITFVSMHASASELTVRVRHHKVDSSTAVGPRVEVVATRIGPVPEPTSVVARTDAAGAVELQLQKGSWSIAARSSVYWAAPQVVDLQGASAEVDLALWPAARIMAAVDVPRGEELPKHLALRFRRASGAAEDAELPLPQGRELDCPLDGKGAASCVVPAGAWNLRLKAAGFAATYRWAVVLPAAKQRDLGTLALRRGTSLTGQVVTEDGPVDPRRARVAVSPLAACRPDSQRHHRESGQLVVESAVDERGYFVVYDLPPGDYEVTARQPGYAPASMSAVLLKDGLDTVIQSALELRRPLLLELSIDPAKELHGGEWAVRLVRLLQGGRLEIAAEGVTTRGIFRPAPLPPCEYRVEVSDSRGNQLAENELRLDTGAQQHRIELDLIPVDGKVLLGGKPLAALIWFGSENDGGLSIEGRSGADGEFHVVLPSAGKWSVDVRSDEPPVQSRKLVVEIGRPQGSRAAQTTIELPDTVLSGEVVDGSGNALGNIPVQVVGLAGQPRQASLSSGRDGRFELRGEHPGSYQLQATTNGASSPAAHVLLQEGVEAGPVRLVLRPSLRVEGRVRSHSGPVPLAWILGYPLTNGGAMAGVDLPQVTSGMDGSFSLEVPQETGAVRLVVLAGGFDLHVETFPAKAGDGGILTVSLDRGGGTLRLVGLGNDPSSQAVMIDGEPVERQLLDHWAGMNGSTRASDVVEVPAMPSAGYAVCRTTPGELMLVMTGGAAGPRGSGCVEGYLPPGGELSLSLPPQG